MKVVTEEELDVFLADKAHGILHRREPPADSSATAMLVHNSVLGAVEAGSFVARHLNASNEEFRRELTKLLERKRLYSLVAKGDINGATALFFRRTKDTNITLALSSRFIQECRTFPEQQFLEAMDKLIAENPRR